VVTQVVAAARAGLAILLPPRSAKAFSQVKLLEAVPQADLEVVAFFVTYWWSKSAIYSPLQANGTINTFFIFLTRVLKTANRYTRTPGSE
jgi:hypothetical protein